MLTSKASLETGKVQGDAKKSVARLYDVLDSGYLFPSCPTFEIKEVSNCVWYLLRQNLLAAALPSHELL